MLKSHVRHKSPGRSVGKIGRLPPVWWQIGSMAYKHRAARFEVRRDIQVVTVDPRLLTISANIQHHKLVQQCIIWRYHLTSIRPALADSLTPLNGLYMTSPNTLS